MVYQLGNCLTGTASDFFERQRNRRAFSSSNEVLAVMSERFGSRRLPQTALYEFHNMTLDPGESLEDWADRLEAVAEEA